MIYPMGLFKEAAQLQKEVKALCQCLAEVITDIAAQVASGETPAERAPSQTPSL